MGIILMQGQELVKVMLLLVNGIGAEKINTFTLDPQMLMSVKSIQYAMKTHDVEIHQGATFASAMMAILEME